jgi:hypothetical protein
MWDGQTVAVMASGASLTAEVAEAARHLPRIVTNATYRRAPDADVIYASDTAFWRHKEYADVFDCPGLRVSCEQVRGVYPNVPPGVMILRHGGSNGFADDPTAVRTGSNSGYAAIHIAATAGAKRILLLGLDMTGGHWHGPHPQGLNNPLQHSFARWIRYFDGLAPQLKERGVEVLNCSPISALTCFPKTNLAECL